MPDTTTLLPESINTWYELLEDVSLGEVARDPAATAILSADMVVGFCEEGALASTRIGALKSDIVGLFRRAHDLGVRDFVLLQDTHEPDALEFQAFPAHCVRGTAESQTIPELVELPFASDFTVIEKNTLTPAIGTGLEGWLEEHPQLRTAIVVGDCTDFCVYHAATYLRLRANARTIEGFSVVVPALAVDTYDVPAGSPGAMAHDGDFFHRVFLYHMALSGIRVVRALS
jgi:nicotinamidase-related amidase